MTGSKTRAAVTGILLDPLDETTLGMRGYYPGVTLELSPEGALALVHRGRVRLPEGASTDDERAPWELFTSHTPLDV